MVAELRILAIATCVPDAESIGQTGSTIWVMRTITDLLSVGEVTLLCPGHPPAQLTDSPRLETLITNDPPRRRRFTRFLQSISTGTLPAMWAKDSRTVRSYLSSPASTRFDVCILTDEYAGIFLDDVPPQLPVIFIRHNLFDEWARARTSSRLKSGIRGLYHAWLADRFNRRTSRMATILIAGESEQIRRLQALAPGRLCVLMPTLHARARSTAPRDVRGSDKLRAVFVGNFDYEANKDAAAWFVRFVLVELSTEAQSRYEFRFVGTNPPVALLADVPAECDLEFPGFVADIDAELQAADVGIVPVRLGDGVKLKTLTLMNAGLPIVSTTEGVRGLPVATGRDCLVADSSSGFAASLEMLLQPEQRRRIGASASDAMRAYEADARPREVLADAVRQAKARALKRTGTGR